MRLSYQKNEDTYHTIRDVLKIHFEISDRLLTKLKKNSSIFLNHRPMRYLDEPIKEEDFIEVIFPEIKNNSVIPVRMDLAILYEDDSYLILDKPAGIPIHPSAYHYTDSLSNGIAYYYSQKNIIEKIHIVTRLDKNTSGLVIVAKNEYIQENLSKQMLQQTLIKKYLAVVEGHMSSKEGLINAPIKRKDNSIIEREIGMPGKEAITCYEVLQENMDCSLVSFTLKTGRTHQIRVHTAYVGHPILGDSLYGSSSPLIGRQALHCAFLSFLHPISKKRVSYTSSLPSDMQKLLTK